MIGLDVVVLRGVVWDCREAHGRDRIAWGRSVGRADGPEQLVVPLISVFVGFPGEEDA